MKRPTPCDESGFGIIEYLVLVCFVTIICLVGWVVIVDHNKKPPAETAKSTANTPTYLNETQIVANLAKQLPTQYSNIQAPEIITSALTTNLFGNRTWWVNASEAKAGLNVKLSTPTTGTWKKLSKSEQAQLTTEVTDITNTIGQTLQTNGYKLDESLSAFQSPDGGGIVSYGSAAGIYKGPDGDCSLEGWQTIPVSLQLDCAPSSSIQSAVNSQSSYISLLEAANPSIQPITIEADGLSGAKYTGSYQYEAINIAAPNGVDNSQIDGPNFFVLPNGSWQYLGGPSLCNNTTNVNNALAVLQVTDLTASSVINDYCGSLGS